MKNKTLEINALVRITRKLLTSKPSDTLPSISNHILKMKKNQLKNILLLHD